MKLHPEDLPWRLWWSYCQRNNRQCYTNESKTWIEDYEMLLNDAEAGKPEALKRLFKFKAGL